MKLSNFKSVLVIVIIFFISIASTRNRYQSEGVRWEEAARLVTEQHIDPYEISDINWAWRPYWYFDSTFAAAAKKLGSRYLVNPITRWKQGPVYSKDIEVRDLNAYATIDNSKITFSSKPFWIFFDTRKVFVYKLGEL